MKSNRAMMLKTKLILGFIICSVATLAVGIYGIIKLHQIEETNIFTYTHVIVPLGEISDIAVSFQRVRVLGRDIVETEDKSEISSLKKKIQELRTRIGNRLESFQKTIITDDAKAKFAELKKYRADYVAIFDKAMALDEAGNDAEARELMAGAGRDAALHYQETVDALIASKEEQAKNISEANEKQADNATLAMYIAIGLAFTLSITLGLLISHGAMRQLGEDPGYLAEVAGQIAGGDLNVAFRPQKRAGGVYQVLQEMVATMKAKIAEAEQKGHEAQAESAKARQATAEAEEARRQAERAKTEGMLQAATRLEGIVDAVTSASHQLSAQVDQSSRGAEEQSRRVTETATAMEEMNATVLEVAKNASRAAETSDQAKGRAQEGANIVTKVVRGIAGVREQALALKTDMDGLGRQAEGIGRIMNVISDIADQTNLLALNAAIEAARAGDAGRGFAVVADEVRKLAEKTMSATHEVGQAIQGIQDSTHRNMENVDRAARNIEEATTLADQSGEALRSIVTLVDQSSDQVRAIATASEEQSSASEEISRSVEQVATISSQTAQAMNEAARAVSELARQSQMLQRLISEMKS